MARMIGRNAVLALAAFGVGVLCVCGAEGPRPEKLEVAVRDLDAKVLPAEGLDVPPPKQLVRHVRAGLEAANRRETRAWEVLRSRADWEQYRDARIRALRESLGLFPPPPADLKIRVTGTIPGTGFAVEKLAFVSRPGLVVTANLCSVEPLAGVKVVRESKKMGDVTVERRALEMERGPGTAGRAKRAFPLAPSPGGQPT
jgi:hypothetical protein